MIAGNDHLFIRRLGVDVEAPDRGETMAAIAADVAYRHRLSVVDLKSGQRRRDVAWPRQESMWMMRQVKRADGSHRFSLPQIGRFHGGRDHSTVFHGVQAHEARLIRQGQLQRMAAE